MFRVLLLALVGGTLSVFAEEDHVINRAVLVDPNASLTIDQAVTRTFTPEPSIVTGGYTEAAHWVRIRVWPDEKGGELILRIRPTFLDQMTLFWQDPVRPGRWNQDETGDQLSRRLKPVSQAETELFLEARTLTLRGEFGSASVSAQEATLLATFARAPDGRLEGWQILEIFPRVEQSDGRGAIRVVIFRLTRKLREVTGRPRPIRAIRNWGYQLSEPIRLRQRATVLASRIAAAFAASSN